MFNLTTGIINVYAICFLLIVIGLSTVFPILLFFLLIIVTALHYYYTPKDRTEPKKVIVRANNSNLAAKKQLYLTTAKWQDLRTKRLAIDNYTCQQCGIRKPLEVHHITYARLFNENIEDLVSVCRECHQLIHNKYGYDYSYVYPIIKWEDRFNI